MCECMWCVGKFKLKIQQQKYNLSSLKPFSLIILCASECISSDNNLKEFDLGLISVKPNCYKPDKIFIYFRVLKPISLKHSLLFKPVYMKFVNIIL